MGGLEPLRHPPGEQLSPVGRVLVLALAHKAFTRSLAPRWARPLSPRWERSLVVPAGTAQQHEGLPSLRAPPLRRSQPRSGCWEAELCVLPPPAFPGVSAIPLHPLHPAEHGEVSSSTGRFSVSSTARFFPSADPGRLTGAGQE